MGQPSESSPRPSIQLNPIMDGLIEQLATRYAEKTGEPVALVRRAIEIAVVTRGVEAVQVELLTGEWR